jgi:hypothetical protein
LFEDYKSIKEVQSLYCQLIALDVNFRLACLNVPLQKMINMKNLYRQILFIKADL